jgi:hypothetical protein
MMFLLGSTVGMRLRYVIDNMQWLSGIVNQKAERVKPVPVTGNWQRTVLRRGSAAPE